MGYRRVLAVVLGLMPVAACSTFDQRLDPDAPDPVGGREVSSRCLPISRFASRLCPPTQTRAPRARPNRLGVDVGSLGDFVTGLPLGERVAGA